MSETWTVLQTTKYRLFLSRPPLAFVDKTNSIIIVKAFHFQFDAGQYLPLNLAWIRRAVRLTKQYVALITANAYISTLGGGHFLCHHLGHAKVLAQLQLQVAHGLGDDNLIFGCYMHMIYNWIQRGKFRLARQVLKKLASVAQCKEEEHWQSVIEAARIYVLKTKQLHRTLAKQKLRGHDPLVDNYYRQRIYNISNDE